MKDKKIEVISINLIRKRKQQKLMVENQIEFIESLLVIAKERLKNDKCPNPLGVIQDSGRVLDLAVSKLHEIEQMITILKGDKNG